MPLTSPARSLIARSIGLTAAAALALPLASPAMAAEPETSARSAEAGSHGGAAHGSRFVAAHSLRAPVTDENFYFVMADRFANGTTSNDTGGLGDDPLVSGFDPTNKGFYNGGDLKGLESELDYIQGMGITSIWLTPSFKNKAVQLEDGPSAGYHGYWITDFTQIDPHLGTNEDLADLISAAHGRGMKVYFDIITNHTADVIGYEEGARTAYVTKDQSPYTTANGQGLRRPRLRRQRTTSRRSTPTRRSRTSPVLDDAEEDLKVPAWLNDVTLYHNRGNTTFTGEDSQYGDFFGLDDLFTENPKVAQRDAGHLQDVDQGLRGRRLPRRHHEARERRVLADVRARHPELRQGARQAELLHVRRGRPRRQRRGREGVHVALDDHRQGAGGPRLPVPGRGAELRLQEPVGRGPRDVLRQRRLVHRRRLQRLRAPDVPRQPRHGPHRPLPAAGQRRGERQRAAPARQARPRAPLSRARQPDRLLRRRAGLHGHRRRPVGAPDACSPARSTNT